MKKAGKNLLVIACVIGVAVVGVRLAMDRQVRKMVERLDAVAVVAPECAADGAYVGTAETPLVKVTVEATVQGHALKGIVL